jgi:hypothetical protein
MVDHNPLKSPVVGRSSLRWTDLVQILQQLTSRMTVITGQKTLHLPDIFRSVRQRNSNTLNRVHTRHHSPILQLSLAQDLNVHLRSQIIRMSRLDRRPRRVR